MEPLFDRPTRFNPDDEGPKYVVTFQIDFDDHEVHTPQQAAIEAMRLVQSGQVWADVIDRDNQQWAAKFENHVLMFFETRTQVCDPETGKLVDLYPRKKSK